MGRVQDPFIGLFGPFASRVFPFFRPGFLFQMFLPLSEFDLCLFPTPPSSHDGEPSLQAVLSLLPVPFLSLASSDATLACPFVVPNMPVETPLCHAWFTNK